MLDLAQEAEAETAVSLVPAPGTDRPPGGLALKAFLAFCATRPREESFELIDGVARMMVRPQALHQMMAQNLAENLNRHFRARRLPFFAALEVSVQVPGVADTVFVPDVAVLPYPIPEGAVYPRFFLACEVLSPGNTARDVAARLNRYAAHPDVDCVLVAAQRSVRLDLYRRANGFRRERFAALGDTIAIDFAGASVAMHEIYADTPHAPRS